MLNGFKNFKQREDAGLGVAIAWFTGQGMTVSLPLTDSQDYDLVVDINGSLSSVQVRTTSRRERGKYSVGLRVVGGNRSGTGKAKNSTDLKYDYLFALTADGDMYVVPKHRLPRSTLSLGPAVAEYCVGKHIQKFADIAQWQS